MDSDSFYNALFSIGVSGEDALKAWREYQRLLQLKDEV